jgi:hypothetical protein
VIANFDKKVGGTVEVYLLLNVLTVPGQIDQVCNHFYAYVQRPTVGGSAFRRIRRSHFCNTLGALTLLRF